MEGLCNQPHSDRRWSKNQVGINSVYEDIDDEVMKVNKTEGPFFDDITGQPLVAVLDKQARKQ